MGVSGHPGGMALQLGRTDTAVSTPSPGRVGVAGAVGVPVARGMAGRGVLVAVAFKLVMAMAMGEGNICRCNPSSWASSRASSTVNNTPPVMSRWVRQLPVGIVS